MTSKTEILKKNGLKVPSVEILDIRWKARFNDWYIKTESGWLWYDALKQIWKTCKDPD